MTAPLPREDNPLERPHVLVVDDDRKLRQLIGRYLEQNGFIITEAENAAMARSLLDLLTFDVMVLDIMMPGEDGISLTQSLQESGFKTPILLLTAKSEAESRIAGFEAGADDYLPKPFEPRELALRLSAILRRTEAQPAKNKDLSLSFDGWVYDASRQLLMRGDDVQNLTKAEATLLNIMGPKTGKAFSRSELAHLAQMDGQERTIDVQVTRLRRKLEPDAKKPRYLLTVRGEGYVLHTD